MRFSEYANAMSELDRAGREKLLTKARCDSTLPVAEYIKLENLDQALCSIEDRKEHKA